MKHDHSVIVLGLYFPGIDIIKDFRKRKIRCIGIDCYSNVPGLYLRKTQTFICPDPDLFESKWVQYLLNFAKDDVNKPLLMITSDKFILPVLKNAELLSKYFIFNHSINNSIEKLMSKSGLVEAAIKSNVSIAKTIFYTNNNIFLNQIDQISYPCLIRPAFGKKWWSEPLRSIVEKKKLILVENRNDLDKWLKKIVPYDSELMIQEMIPGPDENLYYLVVYIDKDQNCLGYFCGQKIRITPIHFGSASFMITVDSEPVFNEALRLLKENNYWGPAGVEFKKNEKTAEFNLVEINTRFGLWDVIGTKLGVDLFYQAYLDLTNQHPLPLIPRKINYKWISITRDLSTFIAYRKEKLITTFDWLKSFKGKVYYADIYWTEPKIMHFLYTKRILLYVSKKINFIFFKFSNEFKPIKK